MDRSVASCIAVSLLGGSLVNASAIRVALTLNGPSVPIAQSRELPDLAVLGGCPQSSFSKVDGVLRKAGIDCSGFDHFGLCTLRVRKSDFEKSVKLLRPYAVELLFDFAGDVRQEVASLGSCPEGNVVALQKFMQRHRVKVYPSVYRRYATVYVRAKDEAISRKLIKNVASTYGLVMSEPTRKTER